jgi:hypothetical protein
MPMETEAPAKSEGTPALEFSKLWMTESAGPDVFAFLSAHPDITNSERLEVLLVDQRERWLRRTSLPLRVYLSAFPELAARGEMVRALVDGDRAERRRRLGVQIEAIDPNTLDIVSETPTQPIEGPPAPDDTQVEGESARPPNSITVQPVPSSTGLRTTRNPTNASPTEQQVSFSMDEAYHLQAEAESLRAMLNTVRSCASSRSSGHSATSATRIWSTFTSWLQSKTAGSSRWSWWMAAISSAS